MIVTSQQRYIVAHSEGGDPNIINRDHCALLAQVGVNFGIADGRAFVHSNNQATLTQVTNFQSLLLGIVALAQTAIQLAERSHGHPDFLSLVKVLQGLPLPPEQTDDRTGVDGEATNLDGVLRFAHCLR